MEAYRIDSFRLNKVSMKSARQRNKMSSNTVHGEIKIKSSRKLVKRLDKPIVKGHVMIRVYKMTK